MKFGFVLIAASVVAWGQVAVNSAGIVQTGLSAAQDNLLGPLIPSGNSPWIFGDLAETVVANNMAPAALAEAPVLGTALPGTGLMTQNRTICQASVKAPNEAYLCRCFGGELSFFQQLTVITNEWTRFWAPPTGHRFSWLRDIYNEATRRS